jgi:hypothetical protein
MLACLALTVIGTGVGSRLSRPVAEAHLGTDLRHEVTLAVYFSQGLVALTANSLCHKQQCADIDTSER